MSGLQPNQIEFGFWRKTALGASFKGTVACPGGWVCLLRTFEHAGLNLVASVPGEDWGFIPQIKLGREVLRGYDALGYIVKERKTTEGVGKYGRAIFALPGKSPFDAQHQNPIQHRLDAEANGKAYILKRIASARRGLPDDMESPVHYVAHA
jgi:hypothetical protein